MFSGFWGFPGSRGIQSKIAQRQWNPSIRKQWPITFIHRNEWKLWNWHWGCSCWRIKTRVDKMEMYISWAFGMVSWCSLVIRFLVCQWSFQRYFYIHFLWQCLKAIYHCSFLCFYHNPWLEVFERFCHSRTLLLNEEESSHM